jgi:tripartite-type tricarboxylate transporter receptor subunit TctC
VKSATYLYDIAPKDGSVLGMFNQSMAQRQMLEPQLVPFDTGRFNWIGAMGSSVNIFITWHASGVATLEDAKKKPVVMGALSDDGGNAVYPLLINKFLGTQFKVVLGYQGGNTIQLAMERGEVDIVGAYGLPGIMASHPDWIQRGEAVFLYQAALKRSRVIPNVPALPELALTDEGREALRAAASTAEIGRSIITTPGVPPERLRALRDAFQAMLKDPDFIAECERRNLLIDGATGEEMDALVRDTLRLPEGTVRMIGEMMR